MVLTVGDAELRLLRDETTVYAALDVLDRDITKKDLVTLAIGVDIRKLAPSGMIDGTIDNSTDEDVRWTIEQSFPIAQLGEAPIGVSLSPCKGCPRTWLVSIWP